MGAISSELPEHYLQPGEVYLARSPALLKTVLGSCVGVTFFSPRLGAGALCHGVLPRCPCGLRAPEAFRYVDFAILELTRQFEALGANRGELQVKVFGGADVLPVQTRVRTRATVGHENWHTALKVLHDGNLCVLASDIGGSSGRTIQFNTGTGEVLLHRLTHLSAEENTALRLAEE